MFPMEHTTMDAADDRQQREHHGSQLDCCHRERGGRVREQPLLG